MNPCTVAIYFVISEQVTKCNLLFYNYFIWFEYLHCKSNVILGMNIKCCMLLICTLYVCMDIMYVHTGYV